MGCQRGQRLTFIAEPDTDAILALDQIVEAVRDGLGEEVEPIEENLF